ncbi:MAG: 50S ribosomal protein L11 methyltransferase, partial [Chitinophagales bacterium]
KKGASHVLAIDNNEWAYNNARDNVALNKIYDEIDVELGEIDIMDGKHFDIILANINKPIIIENIPLFFRTLNSGGLLIISGILQSDIEHVLKEAKNYFFNVISTRTKNDWICVVLQNG